MYGIGLFSIQAHAQLSSNPNKFLGNITTRGNVEAGVSPDYDITKKNTDGTTDYSDFRNFKLLDQIVDDHYGT